MPYVYQVVTNASQDRLEKLIQERLQPGADKAQIDTRIWDLFGEQWAVMFTDLTGFSRRVAEFGIIHFLQTIFESQRVLVPCIERFDGILVKSEGDSLMVIFRSAQKALDCSLEMQRCVKEYNQGREETEQILLCVGLGYGRILRIGDHDVFGAEVNAASKLGEDMATSWEVLLTADALEEICRLGGLPAGVTVGQLEQVPSGAQSAYRVFYPL
ncbi:MAG TPA: adenylate/guanylate cyclase domain-containing protein [Gammaproteobacteria bacterium]